MTESDWLTSDDGDRMLLLVDGRLFGRKRDFCTGLRHAGSLGVLNAELRRLFGTVNVAPDALRLSNLLREQLGNPFRPYAFDHRWRTETVVALASAIEADHAFDRMPILADALEDAGCDERPMLDHLRGPGPHARGCWVLDLILNREPELFCHPPLMPTPRRMKLGPFTPPPEGMA